MKVKVPLLILLLMAAAVGYMYGTEGGRAQRDIILVKLGRGKDPSSADDATTDEPVAEDSTEDEAAAPS